MEAALLSGGLLAFRVVLLRPFEKEETDRCMALKKEL